MLAALHCPPIRAHWCISSPQDPSTELSLLPQASSAAFRTGPGLSHQNQRTRVVITGGAGYVGSHTVHALSRAGGYELLVIDSLESGHAEAVPEGVALKVLALDDAAGVVAVLRAFRPHALIDFAAYLDVAHSQSQPQEYVRNNVQNFKHVLDAMLASGCKLIIKSSTQASCPALATQPCLTTTTTSTSTSTSSSSSSSAAAATTTSSTAGDLRRRASRGDASARGVQRRGRAPLPRLKPRRRLVERHQPERRADLRPLPRGVHGAVAARALAAGEPPPAPPPSSLGPCPRPCPSSHLSVAPALA